MRNLGFVLCVISFLVVVFDILTNRIQGWWLLLIILPGLAGLALILGPSSTLVMMGVMLAGVGSWIWVEELTTRLHGTRTDRFQSIHSRGKVLAISCGLICLFLLVLYPSIQSFVAHLYRLAVTPELAKVVVTFFVLYIVVVVFFGLLFASLHLRFGSGGFASSEDLRLRDFLVFSACNVCTLAYRDMSPRHWIVAAVAAMQVVIGTTLLGIYLAGAFTFIVPSSR